tara:strand:+ start:40513 stop:40965 length:453 start_codon:yes stop_codon:yes gene_type:complete
MSDKGAKAVKGHDFSKKNKVSVWASQYPYEDIPEEYFDETFSRNNTRAANIWSANFNLRFFNPENMETNGAHEGIVHIKKAVGECSFSTSYIDVLMSKARKKKLEEVTWIVLLFEYEYSPKVSGVEKDNYMTFLGAFDYDNGADNLYEAE